MTTLASIKSLAFSAALILGVAVSGCSAEIDESELSPENAPEADESESGLGFETVVKVYDLSTGRPITWEQCMADTTGQPFVYFAKTDYKMTCLRLRVHVLERHHNPVGPGKTAFEVADGWTQKDVAALISGVIQRGQRRETNLGTGWQQKRAFQLQNGKILPSATYCVFSYKGQNLISTAYPLDPSYASCY